MENAHVNRCFLYGEDKESIEHILNHWSKFRELGTLLFGLVGVAWVLEIYYRLERSF